MHKHRYTLKRALGGKDITIYIYGAHFATFWQACCWMPEDKKLSEIVIEFVAPFHKDRNTIRHELVHAVMRAFTGQQTGRGDPIDREEDFADSLALFHDDYVWLQDEIYRRNCKVKDSKVDMG